MTVAALAFRSPAPGRQRLAPRTSIPRHRHRHGYISIVLSGGYEEAGLGGRFALKAGDVVVHRSFDAHLDHVRPAGSELLNLPLPPGIRLPTAFQIEDLDIIARLAEQDPQSAAFALVPGRPLDTANDWPDELALTINRTPELQLGTWAAARGLAAETLSRGFRKAFGITPARFRMEMQAQRALQQIEGTDCRLADIAAECGFSDQPHLTRSIAQLTGYPPGYWRRASIPFKTCSGRRT